MAEVFYHQNDGTPVATKEHEYWKTAKNLRYLKAISAGDNPRFIIKIVESMGRWASEHNLPLEAVKAQVPARWTRDGRLVISFMRDPEWED